MDPPTLAELVHKVGISQDTLDQECSDAHLVSISHFLDWRTVAPHLGLNPTEIGDIDCKREESEKRVETLQKWKKKFGFKAKFRVLVQTLLKNDNADHAEKVCRLLKQQAEDTHTISGPVPPSLPPTSTSTSASTGDTLGSQAKFTLAREVSPLPSETMSLSPESTPGSTSDTTSSFSYLNIGSLSSKARVALESRLLKDSDNIMSEFGDLIHHTVNSIASKVSVKELRIRLSSLGAYRPTRDPVPLLRNQMDEIERAEDVLSVFCILDKYYSFFNYGIIEKLIGWFGTPEDKERLQTYTESFKRFCKRRTLECPPDIFGHTVDKGKTDLVVKVEESWDPMEGCSLENVRRLCNKLADILEVEPETLYLRQINKGCVELLFQVPSFVEEDIFPLSMEQERSLTSIGVTRLTCGSYRFPQPPEALVPQTSAQAESEVEQKRGAQRRRHIKPVDNSEHIQPTTPHSRISPGQIILIVVVLGIVSSCAGYLVKQKLEELKAQWEIVEELEELKAQWEIVEALVKFQAESQKAPARDITEPKRFTDLFTRRKTLEMSGREMTEQDPTSES